MVANFLSQITPAEMIAIVFAIILCPAAIFAISRAVMHKNDHN